MIEVIWLQVRIFTMKKFKIAKPWNLVRALDAKYEVLETYVITGPIFDSFKQIRLIGERDNNGISVPVPSHFFKCVVAEERNGQIKMWAFELENKSLDQHVESYRVTTSYLEQRTGILLWGKLAGPEIQQEKDQIRKMW